MYVRMRIVRRCKCNCDRNCNCMLNRIQIRTQIPIPLAYTIGKKRYKPKRSRESYVCAKKSSEKFLRLMYVPMYIPLISKSQIANCRWNSDGMERNLFLGVVTYVCNLVRQSEEWKVVLPPTPMSPPLASPSSPKEIVVVVVFIPTRLAPQPGWIIYFMLTYLILLRRFIYSSKGKERLDRVHSM
ncbi:hypothetical protein BCIN_05g00470 [Botrytis cinerea B05.10]|uniref:Uncharacterized protein n=1 Tax=Botryotinia fuckeliana (strain B05.10) TaxID=332648 RepID=A0A384JGG7_BOTFB|nr:hypothetical protein BCIN_05g00470 [Botrytis cinerea B05.10]ATZ49620.1 hypothetical protein BCIN_05g00470 [Botrytis cinerea B05.10]